MDSNTHSTSTDQSTRRPPEAPDGLASQPPDGLATLAAAVDQLAAQDPTRLPAATQADELLVLVGLVDRLDGLALQRLAVVDALGAAGAEQGVQVGSTAGWLRARLRLGAGAAHSLVRTARALFRGPLARTGQALTNGEITPAHARVLAHTTHDLPAPLVAEAEPVLLEAARRLDPPQLRRAVDHLRWVADPDTAHAQAERRHARRGLWLSPTLEGMVAVDGLLEPEAGHTVLAALEPLARPADAQDERSGSQRRADALAELARRQLEGGRLPRSGGVRPQLLVTVDVDRLLDHHGSIGGELGGGEPLGAAACRRLACDGAVTRVLVTRHPDHGHQHPEHGHQDGSHDSHGSHDHDLGLGPDDGLDPDHHHPDGDGSLAARLRQAARLLPAILGGARSQPLDLSRTTRVVTGAQRAALVVRDGGCRFPGCQRPPGWCEAHHLVHWLHGGPTDLANLVLVCRAHHRAVHEGGWRLQGDPEGRLAAIPPHRRPRSAA